MRNKQNTGTAIVEDFLKDNLPGWKVVSLKSGLRLKPPNGKSIRFRVEFLKNLSPKEAQLFQSKSSDMIIIAAPFLSVRTREILTAREIGYVDATGNACIVAIKPELALALKQRGLDKNPNRTNRKLASLKGPAAGRIVRALCDYKPPFGIRQLASLSSTPFSSVSRVTSLLDSEALLTKRERGSIVEVDWPKTLIRWVQDYALDTSNKVHRFIDPRGIKNVLTSLKDYRGEYAVTGSLACQHVVSLAPAANAFVFVDDLEQAKKSLKLKESQTATNVVLLEPFADVVFDRTSIRDGVTYVGLSQAAADLLTSPGRGPVEGEELINWMEQHENEWRL